MTEKNTTDAGNDTRLDSWKTIAEYLGRDQRTVRRWEQTLGLPIRRVPGGRGRSVFAFKSELDAWLGATRPASIGASSPAGASPAAASPAPELPAPSTQDAPARVDRSAWTGVSRWSIASLCVLAAGAIWVTRAWTADDVVSAHISDGAVVAVAASGAERWRHALPEPERGSPWIGAPTVFRQGMPGVLAAVAMGAGPNYPATRGGQLLWLTLDGELARTWELQDQFTYPANRYGAPWVISDVQPRDAGKGRLIAVAAHHFTWWPGVVTVLDESWRRVGTFTNPGWVEQVRWLGGDRLVAAGFSNERDSGVVALLDARALDGQSPVVDTRFECQTCGSGTPLRYVVLPRSEVNRASGGAFNRARLEVFETRLLAHTVEALRDEQTGAATALYEFSRDLMLQSASFSDRYWDEHRRLEGLGVLDHDRGQCPERDGPQSIGMWDPESGWRTIPTR